jgi:hypothetical protein
MFQSLELPGYRFSNDWKFRGSGIMATWLVIADTDLNDYLVGAQMNAFRTAALARGQVNPFATIMQDRCSYVRNRISKRVQISATPYAIPPELKTCACMLIIEAMAGRLAVAITLTEDQVRMIRRAYLDLDIAGTDELPISLPDDPVAAEVQAGGAVRVVNKRDQLRGKDMAGL